MLDFSQEQQQSDGQGVQIPDGSIVKVRLKLGDAGQYSSGHNSVSCTKNGLLQLVVDFEMVNTEARDMRYERITLPKGLQTAQLTQGQTTAANIGGAQLKAIMQACGNQSCAIQQWEDLNGLEFPVLVSGEYEESKGSHYWNNHFKKVITPDNDAYQTVMSGTDVMSDTPIPERPAQAAPTGGYQQAPQQQQPWQNQGSEQPAQQQNNGRPAWTQQGGTRQPFNGGGNGPCGTEDIPF